MKPSIRALVRERAGQRPFASADRDVFLRQGVDLACGVTPLKSFVRVDHDCAATFIVRQKSVTRKLNTLCSGAVK